MMENERYIDINKGFRRLGNTPGFADEIYTSYTEAEEYAKRGPYGGTAFIGQLIRVIPQNSVEDPKLYIIDNSWNLISITETISTDSKLNINFDYSSYSGSSAIAITVPAGFLLDSISIIIKTPFKNDDAVSIGVLTEDPDNPIHYYVTSLGIPNQYDNHLVTDEENSEFVFSFMEIMPKQTTFYVFLKRVTDPEKMGSGTLKIN